MRPSSEQKNITSNSGTHRHLSPRIDTRSDTASSFEDRVARSLESYRTSLPPPPPVWPKEIRRIMRYLHTHLYQSDLQVRDIVDDCEIIRPNVSGRFSAYVGSGIKGWLVNHRVEAGKQLLQFPSLTIIAVALRVGFPSHSAFTKAFKARMASPPSRWRKELTRHNSNQK